MVMVIGAVDAAGTHRQSRCVDMMAPREDCPVRRHPTLAIVERHAISCERCDITLRITIT